MSAWLSGRSKDSWLGLAASLVGFSLATCSIGTTESVAAGPGDGGSVVGWNEVHAAVGGTFPASPKSSGSARKISVVRDDAAIPPPPRQGLGASAVNVHPASLAGVSSSVVPAVTGDLYWSRPALDMRVIGQSLGQQSSLRLSRPSVGVSVGTTSTNPPFVGIK